MELCFEGLVKNYGKKQALKGIDLTLTPGIYGLLGPNGAGKSTLMNILTGNLEQTRGQITFDGRDIRTLGPAFRGRLGYCPQQPAFYPTFTADEFLFYMASLHGMDRKAAETRISWALELLSLARVRHEPIGGFSGGMKQRLLIAAALIHDPDILVLDEPTAGLDPEQRIAVRNLIGRVALNKIVILSTHVVPDVEFIAKELILLDRGQVLCRQTPEALLKAMAGQVWSLTVDEDQVEAAQSLGQVCGIARAGDQVAIRLLTPTPPKGAVEAAPTLDDVYLRFFGPEAGL